MPTNRLTPYLPAIEQALIKPPQATEYDAGYRTGYDDGYARGVVNATTLAIAIVCFVAWWVR